MVETVQTDVYNGRATITFDPARHTYRVNVPAKGVTGLYQPSVTSVLNMLDKSSALVPWAVRCMYERFKHFLDTYPEPVGYSWSELKGLMLATLEAAKLTYRKVKDDAATIGSAVHLVLEQELKARAKLVPHPALPLVVDAELTPGMTADMVEKANAAIRAGFRYFDEHEIEIIHAEAVRWSPTFGYLGTGDLIARIDGELAVLDYKTSKRLYPTVWLQLAAYQAAYQEEYPNAPLARRYAINVGRDGTLETKSRDNQTYESDFKTFLALLRTWRWNQENTDYKPKTAPAIVGPLE